MVVSMIIIIELDQGSGIHNSFLSYSYQNMMNQAGVYQVIASLDSNELEICVVRVERDHNC